MITKPYKNFKNDPFELICEWKMKSIPEHISLMYDRGEMVLIIRNNAWRGPAGDDAYRYFARGIIVPGGYLWGILYLAEARFMEYKKWRIANGR